jgi:hypothetical protein
LRFIHNIESALEPLGDARNAEAGCIKKDDFLGAWGYKSMWVVKWLAEGIDRKSGP